MKRYTVLVTGVGAIIGYGIIHSLRKSKYNPRIIGIDIYSDAIGSVWCDHFERGLPAADKNFPEFLTEIIVKYQVNLVIPGIEQDILGIVENFDILQESNATFALNRHELIHLFHDKWETHQFLQKMGIKTIKTYCEGDFKDIKNIIGMPMLLKPRRSYASKGIHLIETEEDFIYWKNKLGDNFMVQEVIGDNDHEYTTAIFGLGNGNYSNSIILNRKLSVDGSTAKARVFHDSRIEDRIGEICLLSKPIGPTNFQLRLHEDNYLLLEVNPRISSSSSIRQAFGYNEAEMCIDYFLENKIPEKRTIKRGSAVRYITDYITYESTDC